VYEFGLNV